MRLSKIKIHRILLERERSIGTAFFELILALALIPQGLAGSPNYFGFSNNLVTFINCESLKEIGEMACVTPAQCHSGFGPPPVKIR